jgi:fimbrial chaperone protein
MLGKTLTLTTLFLMLASSGQAFTLKPMSVTMDTRGYGASKTFRLENESSNQVAFQVTIVSREMDADGKETLLPVTNLFTLFPPQGVIAPGQDQSVRLVWRGPAKLADEQCFRIVAEELPVAFAPPEQGRAQIRILLRYQGTVYVCPRTAKADLQVTSLTKTSTNLWRLTITNLGNAHHNLRSPSLTLIDPGGQKTEVSTNFLSSISGENILPHHTRNFLIALPPQCKEQVYQVRLKENE